MATITPRRRKDGKIAYTAQIRVTVGGRQYTESKTLTDLKTLEKWAERREKAIRAGGRVEAKDNPSVGDVLDWYVEDFAPTGRTKVAHIDFLSRHPVAALDAVALTPAQLIKHARGRREEGAGPATVGNDMTWLHICFRAVRLSRNRPELALQAIEDATYILRKERIIGRPKQRDRRPTIDELNTLIEYFSDRDGQLPMVEITLFALFSARRQDEITRLRRSDIDRRRQGIIVRAMKHPREKRDTFCYLTDEALAIIDRQPPGDRIFPYVGKSISAAFTRACKFLEIEDLHFHDLRRECTSWLFELGHDIPRVAGITGHKSWSSLQIYVHLRESGPHDKYANWPWRPA